LYLGQHCQNPDTNQKISNEHSVQNKDLVFNILEVLQRHDTIKFSIPYDNEVKKPKEYIGVRTDTVFTDLIKRYHIDTSDYEVTFICKDGYAPTVSLSQLLEADGYIAIRDAHSTKEWEDELVERFSPAYLVWDITIKDQKHAFPYGVTKIKFVKKKEVYSHATPQTENASVQSGFTIFKQNCIKCHSINRDGGELGPELNYPKNITEYWKPEQLKLFIKNPASFRSNSKMPSLTAITDQEIDRIVEYLKFMVNQKIQ